MGFINEEPVLYDIKKEKIIQQTIDGDDIAAKAVGSLYDKYLAYFFKTRFLKNEQFYSSCEIMKPNHKTLHLYLKKWM